MEKLQAAISSGNCPVLELNNAGLRSIDAFLEGLASISNLKSLLLRRNELTSLPPRLSSLRTLEKLDIADNPFPDVKKLIPSLASLPSLKHLHVTLKTEEDEEAVVMTLTQLDSLNGIDLTAMEAQLDEVMKGEKRSGLAEPVVSSPPRHSPGTAKPTQSHKQSAPTVPVSNPGDIAMKQEDLESVALLYDAIKMLKRNRSSDDEQRLTSKFDQHMQEVLLHLKNKADGLDDMFLRQGEILNAKHSLFDICFTEIIEHAAGVDQDFALVLRKLRQVHKQLFSDFHSVIVEMKPFYMKRIVEIQAQADRAEKETTELLEAAELLEQETQAHLDEKKSLRAEFDREKGELVEELHWLRMENESGFIVGVEESLSDHALELNRRLEAMGNAPAPAPPRSASPKKNVSRSLQNDINNSAKQSSADISDSAKRAVKQGNVRALTLKQLKDAIEDIYTSKVKYDKKCAETHLPRETMEQHLYTFLNQKYGLKSLIIEWVSSIIYGIKRYSEEDNDVAVFGKILRNEIDEEFRYVQKQLKETVAELLRVYLKGKFPLKRDDEISALLKKRTAGVVYQEEWEDIIKYMYNAEDSTAIIGRIKEHIRSRLLADAPAPTRPRSAREDSKSKFQKANKINFSDFLKILLDFQLRGHERFLGKFVATVRQFDKDKNGILNESQFKQLVVAVDPSKTESQLEEMLRLIDPYNHQQITFSEAVTFLSSEIVKMNAEFRAAAAR